MTSFENSAQYISLKKYNQELEAENKAKKNEIDTLYKEVQRLSNKNIISTVTGVLVPNPCSKCEELRKQIVDLQENLRQVNILRAQEKSEYETKIKYLNQKASQDNKSTVTTYRVDKNSDIEGLRKSQESLKTKIQQLKIEKNKQIQQLEKTLTSSKTENQRQRLQYETKIKNLQLQYRNSQKTSSHTITTSTTEYTLNQKIKQLNIKNQELQKKYDALFLKSKEDSTNTEVRSTRYHESDYERLKLENTSLYEKNEFIERKLIQVQEWNKTLREEILMKMHGRAFNNCEACNQMRGQVVYDDQTVYLKGNRQIGGGNINGNQNQINRQYFTSTTNGVTISYKKNEGQSGETPRNRIFKGNGLQPQSYLQSNNNRQQNSININNINANNSNPVVTQEQQKKEVEKSSGIGNFLKSLFKDEKTNVDTKERK